MANTPADGKATILAPSAIQGEAVHLQLGRILEFCGLQSNSKRCQVLRRSLSRSWPAMETA